MCDFGVCEGCGKEVCGDEAEPRYDPYAYELDGDDGLYVLCDDCCDQHAMDV